MLIQDIHGAIHPGIMAAGAVAGMAAGTIHGIAVGMAGMIHGIHPGIMAGITVMVIGAAGMDTLGITIITMIIIGAAADIIRLTIILTDGTLTILPDRPAMDITLPAQVAEVLPVAEAKA